MEERITSSVLVILQTLSGFCSITLNSISCEVLISTTNLQSRVTAFESWLRLLCGICIFASCPHGSSPVTSLSSIKTKRVQKIEDANVSVGGECERECFLLKRVMIGLIAKIVERRRLNIIILQRSEIMKYEG